VLLSKKEETAVNFKTFVCNTRQDAGRVNLHGDKLESESERDGVRGLPCSISLIAQCDVRFGRKRPCRRIFHNI